MENKSHAMAAGLFVALVTVLVLGLAAWLTRDTGVRDTYEISTRDTVSGLQEQAPVRYRGVDVGKVSAIGFDPKAPGTVLMQLEIARSAPMTKATFATLSYQGVTGLAFVQLGDDGKASEPLQPNDGVPPRIPLRPGLLAKLEARGEVIMEQVEQVSKRVNQLLSDDNQRNLSAAVTQLGQAAESAGQLARRLDKTVETRLDPVLADTAVTMRSVRTSADAVGRTADSVGRTADDFSVAARRLNEKDGPVDRLAEGTEALSHAADSFNNATLPRLNRATEDASRAVRALGRAATGINDNPQSLIFGSGTTAPGPGEPGFQSPGGKR